MQFVLGLESIEGTVIEHRINEVLNWDPSKNQGYTPRTKGKRKNDKTQYFTDEMIEYSTTLNENMNYIFGYAKDDREDNTTPFIDYGDKARPESIDKTNYYKKLNKLAWKKRMEIKHGELPESKIELDA